MSRRKGVHRAPIIMAIVLSIVTLPGLMGATITRESSLVDNNPNETTIEISTTVSIFDNMAGNTDVFYDGKTWDIDGDGKYDIIAFGHKYDGSSYHGVIGIYEWDGSKFAEQIYFVDNGTAGMFYGGDVLDIDGDQLPEIVVFKRIYPIAGNESNCGEIAIYDVTYDLENKYHISQKTSSYTDRATDYMISHGALEVADLNGDGKYDIVMAGYARNSQSEKSWNYVQVYEYDGTNLSETGWWSHQWDTNNDNRNGEVELYDVDNDRKLEVITQFGHSIKKSCDGDGAILQTDCTDTAIGKGITAIFNYDSSGSLQLTDVHTDTYTGSDDGGYQIEEASSGLAVTDFDKNDREIDILFTGRTRHPCGGYYDSPIVMRSHYDGAKFIDGDETCVSNTKDAYGHFNEVEVFDADNDGEDEIMAWGWLGLWSGSCVFGTYLFESDWTLTTSSKYNAGSLTNGWDMPMSYGVAIADYDGDDKLEYAVVGRGYAGGDWDSLVALIDGFSGEAIDEDEEPSPDEEDKPDISVERTVTKVSGSNTYDVTLTVTNIGDVTATYVAFAEQLIDLQYIGEPGEAAGFDVYQYKTLDVLQSDYEIWIYSGVMDDAGEVIDFAPGDEYSFEYQVVPIIDADYNWTTELRYIAYLGWVNWPIYLGYSNQATGKSAFGCTQLMYFWDSGTNVPNSATEYIYNTLDTVDGKPIGQADTATDMLIVSSPGAIIDAYTTTDPSGHIDNSDAYRLLGEMARTASEQNGILAFIELGQNDDWTDVDTQIEVWVYSELQWNVQDDSEYYLMIVGNNEIIPFALPDDPLIDRYASTEDCKSDFTPSDTYYADINEDWRQDLCVGRIIAWEISDLIRLMSTTTVDAGNKVTIAYDTDIKHKGQEQATADPEYFSKWYDRLDGYFDNGVASSRTLLKGSPINESQRTVGELFKDQAMFICAGHGEHYQFQFYEKAGSTTASPIYLSSGDLPDSVSAVFITCCCLTARAIDGKMTSHPVCGATPIPCCEGCGDQNCYSGCIALQCIDSGAYAYVGATMKAKTDQEGTVGAAQFTTDLVKEWVDEEQTIGMAFKEAMQNLIDTAPKVTNVYNYDNEVKRAFLEYVLYGNPKFTLDPLPGGGTSAATTSAPASLAMYRGNPEINIDLDFTYTQTEKNGKWSFFTESPGTESVLWRSPLSPILPMNLFTVELPPETAVKEISYTATEQQLGEYELHEQTGYVGLGELSGISTSESTGMPSDIFDYFAVRNPDNSVTLHFRAFPIQYDKDTNTVTFHDNMTITIEYEPNRSSRISGFYTEKSRVLKDRSIDILWLAENMLGSSQYLTAKFSVMDTAGNLVTEFEATGEISANETRGFKTSWTADVAPAAYVIRLDLFDRDEILVDSNTMTLTVLHESVTDMVVIRRNTEEMSTSLWSSGSWIAPEWIYLVAGGGSVNSAFAVSPVAAKEDTTIIVTGTDSLSESIQKILPAAGIDEITIVEVDDELDPAVLGAVEDLGYQVSRISGDTLVELAAVLSTTKWASSNEAVVTLNKYPLAMLAGEYASYMKLPLLFIDEKAVPSVVTEGLNTLGVTDITLISDNTISRSAISALEDYTTNKGGTLQQISDAKVNQLALTVANLVQEIPRMVIVASDDIEVAGAYLSLPNYVEKNGATILLTPSLPDHSLSDETISGYDLERLSQTLGLDFDYLSEKEPEIILILNPVSETEDGTDEAGGVNVVMIIGVIAAVIAALLAGFVVWRRMPKKKASQP